MGEDIKSVKTGFFEEEPGVKSSSRLVAILLIIIPLGLYVYINVMNSINNSIVAKMVEFPTSAIVVICAGLTALFGKIFVENLSSVSDMLGKIAESIIKIKGIKNA